MSSQRPKRVYIAYTGGTIGMKRTDDGYEPVPGYLEELMASLQDFQHPQVPRYEIHEYCPLLDSANMAPEDWLRIGEDIRDHYDEFDGFVVLHGTDTMAYTASALSFMLENLGKPVLLTGSQIPLAELRSDARDNLLASMILAGNQPIPEVAVFFGSLLLRGNRSRKVSSGGLEAFASPNYQPLGHVGVRMQIHWRAVRPRPEPGAEFTVRALSDPHIGAVRLFPGIQPQVLENFLRPPLRGLVLETYGAGNGPVRNPAFLEVLEAACRRGVVVVNTTQCLEGTVLPDAYATGRGLRRAGVVSGYDMTAEAALTKLYYLFGKGLSPEEVRQEVQRDLRGELTEPLTVPPS
jgi:L-asparaginase